MDFTVMSDTTNPPSQMVSTLPLETTWWTVKAYDQFGSTIYADPWLIKLPENRPPVADAGPGQVLYAGLDGHATVTLDGSKSTDPDGDTLHYTWAWAIDGVAYLTNALSLTLELPIGVHTFQLMVDDGHWNSQPDEVTVRVVAPLECDLKIAPSAINLDANGLHILARIRLPDGITRAQAESDEPLVLYPGGSQASRRHTAGNDDKNVSIFAFFPREGLSGVAHAGPAECGARA